jgi:alanine or glycine:cation symporter, AGCS family
MDTTFIDSVSYWVKLLNNTIWGWPLIIFFIAVGLFASVALRFIQFRYFFKAWRLVLSPQEHVQNKAADMSPFQAFVNALSTSIGNGSLAGMATAVHEGGPGAAFWIFVLGFFALPIRFSEVYLSNAFEGGGSSIVSGGPMLYLKKVPGRTILPLFYAFFCLLLSFISGNAIQANSVSDGLRSIIPIANPMVNYGIAFGISAFVAYVLLGGAARIVKISEAIVPLKVGLFFVSALLVLGYHVTDLWQALVVIVTSAFTPQAIKGALLGTTLQTALRFGMSRSLNATEIGLGTAAVFFGSTGSKNPVDNGIMSMVSAFISNYLVCFVLALLIVVTGAWTSPDLTSIALTTKAFSSFYGLFASWLVTVLSILFGIGVLVAYAYIGRECWSYLTGGRYINVYFIVYCLLAFLGSLAKVQLVWDAVDIVNAGLMAINLYAIAFLMPKIRSAVIEYDTQLKRKSVL